MTNLLEKLRQLIQQSKTESKEQQMANSAHTNAEPEQAQETNSLSLNEALVKNLMEMLDHTHEGMYSCAETFALLDEYVELIADDEEAIALMPYVKRHLDKCPDCHDFYAALLNIIQSEPPTTEFSG